MVKDTPQGQTCPMCEEAGKKIAELEHEVIKRTAAWYDAKVEVQNLERKLAYFEATRQRVLAGALYDLFGWLTSRRTSITLSDKHDSGIAVDTLIDFAKMRGLSLTNPMIESWQCFRDGKEELTKLIDQAKAEQREEILNAFPFFKSEEGEWLAEAIRKGFNNA